MRFKYIKDDGTIKYVMVSLNQFPNPVQPVLTLLDNNTLNAIPGHLMRTFQTCDWWVMKDGKINISLFHERFYTPYNIYKKPSTDYWLEGSYKTPMEMVEAIHAKGCDVSKFYAQHHFYTDQECYFPITSDFDEALKFCGYQYKWQKIH